MFDHLLPGKALSFLDKLSDIVVVLFSILIIAAGISMTRQVSRSILYGMHISKGFLYAAVPTAGVTFLIAEIERIMNWGKKGGEQQ